MQKKTINPWKWQDNFGFAQAVEVKQNSGTLYCSGQAAMTAEGRPVGGSMEEQLTLSLENLETLIIQSGYQPSNIVSLRQYTTSISDFFAAYKTLAGWMNSHNIVPSSTLVEVSALAFPELKIEIEAIVVA